jgi:D-alanyl-D-alanine carboxypeptidase
MEVRGFCGIVGRPWAIGMMARLAILVLLAGVVPGLVAAPASANPKFAAMTVDARTGKILFSENADKIRHPASLTKMMTLYIVFQELNRGRLTLNSPIRFSKRAAGMAPSKIGVAAGGTVTVETAIRALVVKSANDVAAAVAENISGSEQAFAQRMTRTARDLGMSRTTFRNASGLPNPAQVTTARDMATLGLRLMRDFPQYYHYFRTKSFVYAGRTIRGHNRLLGSYEGADGIKTGYINASGFNLVSSVRRGDKRVVGVVLGGRTGASRDAYMKAMLTKYFPKARGGKAIAAYAGSSKGAVAVNEASPPESAAETAQTKQAAREESASKRLSKRKTQSSQNEVAAAPAEQGDTEETSIADLAAQAAAQPPAAASAAEQVEVVPQPSPDAATATTGEAPFQVKTPEQQMADQAQVASISQPADAGWIINLGDYATKNDAQAVLQLLRKRAPDAVDGRTAQTVMIEKNGQVTYRARFTGFDEAAAAAACKTIRRQNTPCRAQGPS